MLVIVFCLLGRNTSFFFSSNKQPQHITSKVFINLQSLQKLRQTKSRWEGGGSRGRDGRGRQGISSPWLALPADMSVHHQTKVRRRVEEAGDEMNEVARGLSLRGWPYHLRSLHHQVGLPNIEGSDQGRQTVQETLGTRGLR